MAFLSSADKSVITNEVIINVKLVFDYFCVSVTLP